MSDLLQRQNDFDKEKGESLHRLLAIVEEIDDTIHGRALANELLSGYYRWLYGTPDRLWPDWCRLTWISRRSYRSPSRLAAEIREILDKEQYDHVPA